MAEYGELFSPVLPLFPHHCWTAVGSVASQLGVSAHPVLTVKRARSCRMEPRLISLVECAALGNSSLNFPVNLLCVSAGELKTQWRHFLTFITVCLEPFQSFTLVSEGYNLPEVLQCCTCEATARLLQQFCYFPSCFTVPAIRPGNSMSAGSPPG